MVVVVLLFVVGLVFLIKGGDWFVDGATGIARRFNLPEILIGATVVSIGTTLPEVMVSVTSATRGLGDMAYGNAIGSIICNTALISALTFAIRPTEVDRKTFMIPVIFFFIAAAAFTVISYTVGYFSRTIGICLLVLFVIYMAFTVYRAIKSSKNLPKLPEQEKTEQEKPHSLAKDVLLLVVGAALIAVGAKLLVDNGTKIAQALGVPDSVIALTMVALGTSLPELVTAITALAKGHGALSLGNIIGANLFNIVLVLGASTAIAPFSIPTAKTICGMNAALVVDIPVMLLVMLLMTVPALIRQKLTRFQGILLLAIYAGFCIFQFCF